MGTTLPTCNAQRKCSTSNRTFYENGLAPAAVQRPRGLFCGDWPPPLRGRGAGGRRYIDFIQARVGRATGPEVEVPPSNPGLETGPTHVLVSHTVRVGGRDRRAKQTEQETGVHDGGSENAVARA